MSNLKISDIQDEPKQFEKIAQIVVSKLTQYLEKCESAKDKVLRQETPEKVAEEMNLQALITQGGLDENNVSDFLDSYFQHSQHMHHPHYIGHQVAVPHPMASMADFIHGLINNPMAIYEMGPSAAVIERTIVNWMLQKVGWFSGDTLTDFSSKITEAGGVLTHGGSMANLTVLLAARAKADASAWDKGNSDDLIVLTSESSHYSISRALGIMGLGQQAIYKIATDGRDLIKLEGLKSTYERAINDGKKIMAVIVNACVTSTGLYDPIDEIADFCHEKDLWLHVDAAHGASALLSPKERKLLKGIEKADSVIWDTHKMLRTSTLCAAALFKDTRNMVSAMKQEGSYIFHDKEELGFDSIENAIECTKAGIGTKLFWVLASVGETGLREFLERQYDITKKFYEIIHGDEDFECAYYPESNILCFRYTKNESDEFQLRLRNTLVKQGDFYITSTEIKKKRYLRITVMNPRTNVDHIESLLEKIKRIAAEIA